MISPQTKYYFNDIPSVSGVKNVYINTLGLCFNKIVIDFIKNNLFSCYLTPTLDVKCNDPISYKLGTYAPM